MTRVPVPKMVDRTCDDQAFQAWERATDQVVTEYMAGTITRADALERLVALGMREDIVAEGLDENPPHAGPK